MGTIHLCLASLLFLVVTLTSAWDPDAGLVHSLTKGAGARVLSSSNVDNAVKANDGNDSTHWTSHGCMPGGFYVGNPLTNVLYQACQQGRCSTSSADVTEIMEATDPSTYTGFQVRRADGGGDAHLTVTLPSRQNLRDLTLRGTFHESTQLLIVDGDSEKVVGTLSPSDSYNTRDFNVTLTPATAVSLRSSADFSIYTLGAVGEAGCVERIYVDMGSPQTVRVIRTRHWAGQNGMTSSLVASNDGVTWQTLSSLDPNDVQAEVTRLASAMTFRYLGVEHRQDESNYAKVYMWEIDAYDDSGEFGGPPSPKPNVVSLRDMLGVNGIWGWGWGRSSSTLGAGEGAALYAPVASFGRSYHNLDWDVHDPDDRPNYERMAQGRGTDVQSWLNWDTEYGLWTAANVTVHVSVQFTARDFPVQVWDQPLAAARQYGQAFAHHFGPTNGNGLVRSVEVGNEPWDYPADFYRTVLQGMAGGFKAGDPAMVVMPGAFQAHDPADTGNYIGTRVTEAEAALIDVINGHHYSWRRHDDGSRHATYPEDPSGTFNEILSLVRWRNTNTADKPLWMTEWGWDSPGGGQDCTLFPECTTEAAAAAYAARGLLLHARLDVARSAWFFYGNLDDCDDHVFCRSGLTSSMSAHFVPKGPYHTLQHLVHLLGNTHFLDVLQEDDHAYVYVFGSLGPSSLHTPTHLVAWRPVDTSVAEGLQEVTVTFSYPSRPAHAWRLRMDGQGEGDTAVPSFQEGQWGMAVSGMPTVVQLTTSEGLIG